MKVLNDKRVWISSWDYKEPIIWVLEQSDVRVLESDAHGGLKINNEYIIIDKHPQECYEDVYADWEKSLENTTFDKEKFDTIEIKKCEEGFTINGYFVACYNLQSGYYSSDLYIEVYKKDEKGSWILISNTKVLEW